MKLTVCILTAGLGSRMGERGNILNKALFPLDNKPIITHIIEKFPSNTEFVIALGYKGKQVKSFLKLFHSKNKFIFVNIKKFIGNQSGPGLSLLSCRKYLKKKFIFVSCDTLWNNKISFTNNSNWVGTAKVNKNISSDYCNFSINKTKIQQILISTL